MVHRDKGERSALLAVLVTVLGATQTAPATLTAEGVAVALAGVERRGTPILTTTPDAATVMVEAFDTAAFDDFGLSVTVDASVQGDGTARYGALSGSMRSEGKSAPNDLANEHGASARGRVRLRFVDRATVTSDALPAGTPVVLTFHAVLDSEVALTAEYLRNAGAAAADYIVRVSDQTNPVMAAERVLSNTAYSFARPHIEETLTLTTAVGHVLELSGELTLLTRALPEPASNFNSLVTAKAAAPNAATFSYDAAGGVRLVSESGHDYAAAGSAPADAEGDDDADSDRVSDVADNVPSTADADQGDTNTAGIGDAGEEGVPMSDQPQTANADQGDTDDDRIGDAGEEGMPISDQPQWGALCGGGMLPFMIALLVQGVIVRGARSRGRRALKRSFDVPAQSGASGYRVGRDRG